MMKDEEIIKALKSFKFDLNSYASPHLLGAMVRRKTGKKVTWARVGKIAQQIGVYSVEYDKDGYDVTIKWK